MATPLKYGSKNFVAFVKDSDPEEGWEAVTLALVAVERDQATRPQITSTPVETEPGVMAFVIGPRHFDPEEALDIVAAVVHRTLRDLKAAGWRPPEETGGEE